MKIFAAAEPEKIQRYERATARLRALQAEAQRLRDTIYYYTWLRAVVGIDGEEIKAVTTKPQSASHGTVWMGMDFAEKERARGVLKALGPRPSEAQLISYKLTDGREVLAPWPPFADSVIFNRPLPIPAEEDTPCPQGG